MSWNHFDGTDKTMLLGHDDGNAAQDIGRLKVTYHHNWFDGTNQRNPRVRFGDPVHVYNNYYNDTGNYGVASTMDAGVLVEGNYFENVDDPYHLGEGVVRAGPAGGPEQLPGQLRAGADRWQREQPAVHLHPADGVRRQRRRHRRGRHRKGKPARVAPAAQPLTPKPPYPAVIAWIWRQRLESVGWVGGTRRATVVG